jgi:riboflavin synthase
MVFTGIVQGTAEVRCAQGRGCEQELAPLVLSFRSTVCCRTCVTTQVMDVDTQDKFRQVQVKFPPGSVDNVKLGASVAVNGVCLTVTEIHKDMLHFDIMMETLRATNLGELGAGSVVNFERAAKLGDEIGGHNVSGHVHTTATISRIEQLPNNRRITMTLSDPAWIKYILPKGYIAVDGTSLTVGEVGPDSFSVYLIPETLRVTVFGIKSEGDTVNIEVETQTQAIVDTVEKVVVQHLSRLGLTPGQQQQQQAAAAVSAAVMNGGGGGGGATSALQQDAAQL